MNPKVQELYKKLTEGVQEWFGSGRIQEILAFQARFYRYSFNNMLLIFLQCPNATHVAGYNAWKKMGRQVRRGEKGIQIFAPLIKKETEINNEGKEVEVERLYGFRVTHVFDLSQTDGEPLPVEPPTISGESEQGQSLFDALMTVSPVPVTLEPVFGGSKGYYDPLARKIVVKSGLPADFRAKVLFHEVAHALVEKTPVKNSADRVRAEVVAESSAFVTASYFGLDTAEYSFEYVGRWAEDPEEALKWGSSIQKTAASLIKLVERGLKKITPAQAEAVAA